MQKKSDAGFKVGDMVWLSNVNIKTKRPCKKFDDPKLVLLKLSRKLTSWPSS
jgi:hypothetical protein